MELTNKNTIPVENRTTVAAYRDYNNAFDQKYRYAVVCVCVCMRAAGSVAYCMIKLHCCAYHYDCSYIYFRLFALHYLAHGDVTCWTWCSVSNKRPVRRLVATHETLFELRSGRFVEYYQLANEQRERRGVASDVTTVPRAAVERISQQQQAVFLASKWIIPSPSKCSIS